MVKWIVWSALLLIATLWIVRGGLMALHHATNDDEEDEAYYAFSVAFDVLKVSLFCLATAEIINRL